MWTRGRLAAKVREGKEEAGAKFSDYFDFAEPFTKLPSHRILAMFRGEKEEILDLASSPRTGPDGRPRPGRPLRAGASPHRFGIADQGRPADKWLIDTVRWAWRTRILVHLGIDLRMRLWQAAEDEAVRVFAANLRDLLLAAPAGSRATMGLDPGPAHRRQGGRGRRAPARSSPPTPSTRTSRSRQWDESLAHAGRAWPRRTASS